MKKHLCLLAIAWAATPLSAQTESNEARLLRFPATNSREVVFTYAGDLYTVPLAGGEARRLTSHIGYEMFPRFAPDGKTIAFTGQYDGNTEVYTVSADGGEPLRLTYTSTNSRDDLGDRMGPNNIVMAWTPDGQRIVYRNRIGDSFAGKLKTVGRTGGLSQSIPLPEGGFCCYSPDGKRLAYNRVMREFRTWKYYKGGMADDVWVYDAAAGTVENITRNDAQDIFPMWVGDEIYFTSDRDRTMNLFVYDTRTKQTKKVTDFTDYDIKFPSTDGRTIVFENGGYLYAFDPATKQSRRIRITLATDGVHARSELKNGSRYLTAASLAPGGERLTVTARGEVFDLPAEKGVTKNLTRTPGAHERAAQWSPDGRHIAYITDRTGETELAVSPTDGGETRLITTANDTYILDFDWSPDSKTIAYTDRRNRLCLVDVATAQRTVVVQDTVSAPQSVVFSPDSRWLAYVRTEANDFDVIYLYNIAAKREYPVTDRWYNSFSPTFSADGKYLVFASLRDFKPLYGALEWNHIYGRNNEIYLALLAADTPSPFLQKDDAVKTGSSAADDGKKKEADGKKPTPTTVKIDPEGLPNRIVALPVGSGGWHYNLYSDGKKVYFARNNNTYAYDLADRDEEQVAEGATMQVGPDGRNVLFRKGNQLYVTALPTGKTTLKDAVDLSNMQIATDYPAEWAQIYDEAWRAFRDGFYLENMHGVDWKAMKAKYAAWLPYVKNRLDLNYVIGELIGELNCGHAYVSTGEMNRPQRIKTGLLGAEISRHESGFFRIDKMLPGVSWSKALRSPLADAGINVEEGNYIVAIDGVAANTVNDLYALLTGKADVPTEIAINTRPQLAGARKVVIRPLEEEHSLYHHQWVQRNIDHVTKRSGGRIGYIYVPDMGPGGLIEFTRYFYPQLDKEGLIIDDRANGGGNVSPMLLERLAREPYRLTTRRGSKRIGTIPDAVQVGPKVCLINKYSASDGDLFPWGFRTLGLGKLIGTRTWGGVVGISSSLPFIDGTDIRVPFFTSYDPKTGNWIIENEGVAPDILVDNDPIREWNGEDQQLDRAIDEVMKELNQRRPLAPIPAPRVWNK